MKLPTIAVPTHSLVIPSTKKEVSYRPYLTKEEKLLLMAKESGKESDMMNALKKLIEDCVDGIDDAGKLTSFDFEYVFLKLRAVSSGETITPSFTCDNMVTDEETGKERRCGREIKIAIDFASLEPTFNENHNNKITLTDNGVGVVMKYPTLNMMTKLAKKNLSEAEMMFETMVECIEMVYDAEKTYPASETSHAELLEFIESLTSGMRQKIQTEFFESMPSIQYKTEVECPECGKVHKIVLKGIKDFF
jgi:hypothetical protein